jgi:hypothetical protein
MMNSSAVASTENFREILNRVADREETTKRNQKHRFYGWAVGLQVNAHRSSRISFFFSESGH